VEHRKEWDPEAVASLRARLEMTQAEFSETLGVRQQTVSEWETGMHAPKGASKKLLSMVREQAASYQTGNAGNSRKTEQAGEMGTADESGVK